MTHHAYQELADAARALLPHLETSSDPMDENLSMEDVERSLARSDAEKLRQQADEIEAMEAAIWRFRKAVDRQYVGRAVCPKCEGNPE